MTAIEHIFLGANVHSKRDIIPVYQAAVFLDTQGFDLLASQEGCLTDWFVLSKRGTTVDRVRNYHPFARIDFIHRQREFWDAEAETIQHVAGLVKR